MKSGMWVLALASLTGPAMGQTPSTPVCTAMAPPPSELAGWDLAQPVWAGKEQAEVPLLVPGKAVILTLRPTLDVHYPLTPGKPGGAESFGGLLGLSVEQAGHYRVALGTGAWLDVVGAHGAVRSEGHAHGPDCSGIRKMVNFSLTPGHYTLQIAGSAVSKVTVMAVALP